jgi:hypothetical protein
VAATFNRRQSGNRLLAFGRLHSKAFWGFGILIKVSGRTTFIVALDLFTPQFLVCKEECWHRSDVSDLSVHDANVNSFAVKTFSDGGYRGPAVLSVVLGQYRAVKSTENASDRRGWRCSTTRNRQRKKALNRLTPI